MDDLSIGMDDAEVYLDGSVETANKMSEKTIVIANLQALLDGYNKTFQAYFSGNEPIEKGAVAK